MKKILLVLLFMVNLSSLYSFDFINFDMSVELGIIPGGTFKTYGFVKTVYDNIPLFGDFNFMVNMFNDHLYYGIGSKIIIWKVVDRKNFKPDSVNFVFFAGILINDNIEIKFVHACRHPIKAWSNGHTNIEGWYEELSIKFSFNMAKEE